MSELKERISEALRASGRSKTGLARACGIASSSVTAWFNGKTKVIAGNHAFKAAEYLGVTVEWLTTGEGRMRSAMPEDDDGRSLPRSLVRIREYHVSGGANTAPEFVEVENSKPAVYRREHFLLHGVDPENARVFRIRGDSMKPVLWDGDSVLVDCSPDQHIASGKVYAFAFKGDLRVKRLIPLLNGGLIVTSDNPQVPEERIDPEKSPSFRLIGRVIYRAGDGPF